MAIPVLIIVASVSLGILVVAVIALARQAAHLATTVARFQREIRPILTEIQGDAERASHRMEALSGKDRSKDEGPPKPKDI